MDYSAMIQNRKSVRAFLDHPVSDAALDELKRYYISDCKKLIPSIDTEIRILGETVKKDLEGAAGYQQFMIGAPCYLILLSEDADYAVENAGYITEDLVLKMTELGLSSCWITFDDGERIKQVTGIKSDKHVCAIVAFGYGAKTSKQIRLNIKSMSDIDINVKREFYASKLGIDDLVFLEKWGSKEGVYDVLGDMDRMLWRAFYASSLAPSYLNRQPYGFVLDKTSVVLVSKKDECTNELNQKLNLGIIMLHFAAVISQWTGKLTWTMGPYDADLGLPSDCQVVAHCRI